MKIRRVKYLFPIAYAIFVYCIISGEFGIFLNDALIGLSIITVLYPIYLVIPHYKRNKNVVKDSFHSERMILNINIDGHEHKIAINEIDFSSSDDVVIRGVLADENINE